MPFCERCGKKFIRHRKKGTRRNNAKLCETCKFNRGRKNCIICKKLIKKKVPWQKTCSLKCRREWDKQRQARHRKRYKILKREIELKGGKK